MYVAWGPERATLGTTLAEKLDAEPTEVETKRFPDGEGYVRVSDSLDGPAILVSDLRPDERIVETLLALDALREAQAPTVTLAVPYLAYARQDRAFEPGEGVSSRAILEALAANADRLATVDPHTREVLDYFEGPAAGVEAAPEIADALEPRGVDTVLAPDAGARQRAKNVAEILDCQADHLEKDRKSAHEVEVVPKKLDVDGDTVAIVDDIISTGGTMATATRHLLDAGAERVLLAATHGVLADGALKRLDDAGADDVLVTDAIPSEASEISLAPAMARAVRALPQA
jgi:ribose-phosphate pyrophosphokinase